MPPTEKSARPLMEGTQTQRPGLPEGFSSPL